MVYFINIGKCRNTLGNEALISWSTEIETAEVGLPWVNFKEEATGQNQLCLKNTHVLGCQLRRTNVLMSSASALLESFEWITITSSAGRIQTGCQGQVRLRKSSVGYREEVLLHILYSDHKNLDTSATSLCIT